jgi:hypothetical protein
MLGFMLRCFQVASFEYHNVLKTRRVHFKAAISDLRTCNAEVNDEQRAIWSQQYKEIQENQEFLASIKPNNFYIFFLFFFLLSDCVDHVEPKYALHQGHSFP